MSRPVALVTGARRGIGRAACVALAEKGYDLLGCDLADDGFVETAAAVQGAGGRFAWRLCDVADLDDVQRMVAWAWDEWGGLEALVNNAGVGAMQRGDLLEMSRESWDRCMDINARAPFFCSQEVARRMLSAEAPQRGPRGLVFVSSANAVLVSADRTEYSASKTAVSMVARCFAVRLAEDGIPVYDIRPGVIRTDMTAPVTAKYEARIAAGLSPIRRWGEPEDIGRAIAALVSGALPFSTGDAFHIDGGLHLHRL
ncbi:3-ketoacyl-ACP reductase [Falsiroseomonas sp. E2-1-a20]|uniref:3-ketoacyl-ACP reductase n=1 Tax=Falsiroseomonas sp. E2-1-a20 TaxID=3239300 RepID=UPI003F3A8EEE